MPHDLFQKFSSRQCFSLFFAITLENPTQENQESFVRHGAMLANL